MGVDGLLADAGFVGEDWLLGAKGDERGRLRWERREGFVHGIWFVEGIGSRQERRQGLELATRIIVVFRLLRGERRARQFGAWKKRSH